VRRYHLVLISLLISFFLTEIFAQSKHLIPEESEHRYGKLFNVYQLQSEFILRNSGSGIAYLLRAEADRDLKVWTSKKSIEPGDTALVVVHFKPKKKGRFKHKVKLISGESVEPIVLKISGNIRKLKPDDKTACFYFKNRRPARRKQDDPIVISIPPRNYENIEEAVIFQSDSAPSDISVKTKKTDTAKKIITLLPPEEFKPNNIIFLIDVSGSMADSTKLRWLKLSIKKLIENIRPQDKVSLVCYSDSVRSIAEGLSYGNKNKLIQLTDSIKAKGNTKGNKAIHFALNMAIRNYLPEGNNQIILASDGVFAFNNADYKKWTDLVGDKNILLSAIAFGKDAKAIKNLTEISQRGNGSFIHIRSRTQASKAILEEIEFRSKIQK
jgi:Mg-chelatase subunit ChlD